MKRYTTLVTNNHTGDEVAITLPASGPETARGMALSWAFRALHWHSCSAAKPGETQ